MVPAISKLHPPSEAHRHPALALKLNPEVLQQLRSLHQAHKKPKLVVKDGKFSIKISDSLIFPCTVSPETLRLDVYSPASVQSGERAYDFTGTVTNRLNILSDPKQIKEHLRVSELSESTSLPAPQPQLSETKSQDSAGSGLSGDEFSPRVTSVNSKAYVVSSVDSEADRAAKFVAYIALGPMTREDIEKRLSLTPHLRSAEIDHLFSTHTQSYLRKDTFTESDIYPLLAQSHPIEIVPQRSYVILKDKAYKELRPWQWPAYTEFERSLIINNINHALSRQGFSDTHPLRRRIVERTSPVRKATNSASLGGGFLVSSSKKASTPDLQETDPVISANSASKNARASTESPKMNSEARKRFVDKGKRTIGSPLRHEEASARGRVSSLASSSSSEDEKHVRKHSMATREKRYSNSSSQSNSSMNSSSNSYTSPSSVNEEMHSDPSDHESKSAATKPAVLAASLPNRPSSSFTNHEKKQQYYAQLAEKFRSRYKEYEQLHHQLSKDSRRNSHIEKKKNLTKLFELHNTLSEWKRRLWDYHNENNMAVGVMNLSKHRKSNSMSRVSASAPSTSKVASTDRFAGPNGGPAPRHVDLPRKQPFADRQVPQRPKFALDY